MATPEERAYFDKLVGEGWDENDAARFVTDRRAGPQIPPTYGITPADSAKGGAVRGATWNYDGELVGLASMFKPNGFVPSGAGLTPTQQYTRSRDEWDRQQDLRYEANPKTFLATEIPSGVATGAALPAGEPGLMGAIGTGAMGGAVGGLGASKADLTKNEYGRAALDTAGGAVLGGATGAVVHGATKAGGAIVNRVKDKLAGVEGGTYSGVDSILKDVDPRAPSHLDPNKTVGETHREAMELEKLYSNRLGEPYQFSPAQSTGDPAVAAAEQKASGKYERNLLDADMKRRGQNERLLNSFADDIAARPDQLGRTNVGDEIASGIEGKRDSIRGSRRAQGEADYGDAETLFGDTQFDTSAVSKVGRNELERLGANEGELSAKLRRTIDALSGDKSLRRLRAEKTYWSNRSSETQGNEKRVSTVMATEIQKAIDKTAETGQGPAVEALRLANKNWSTSTKALEEFDKPIFNDIVRRGENDASSTIADKIARAPEDQIKALVKTLDENTAKQLRAQVAEEIMVKGGKPPRDAALMKELGINRLDESSALQHLYNNVSKLNALYEGDNNAQIALRRMTQLLQRAELSGVLHGVDPTNQSGRALAEGVKATAWAAGGVKGGAGFNALRAFVTNENNIGKAISTPEGIQVFNRALEALTAKEPPSGKAQAALVQAIVRLGIEVTPDDYQPSRFSSRLD